MPPSVHSANEDRVPLIRLLASSDTASDTSNLVRIVLSKTVLLLRRANERKGEGFF